MMMGTKSLRACSLLSATGMDPCYVGFLVLTGYFGVAFSGYSMSMKDENLLGEMEYVVLVCLFFFMVFFPCLILHHLILNLLFFFFFFYHVGTD